MAEGYEDSMEILTRALLMSFAEIREGYLALPIPIQLPAADDLDRLRLLQESIVACAARIEDLPAHPVGGKALFNASHNWLAASVAYEQFRATGTETALAASAWCLNEATNLMDLAIALLRQE